jgi:hypothetical protein
MKKSAQGFYRRAGTAGAVPNSRNGLGSGFRSAMSHTHRRVLLNVANKTTEEVQPMKSSVVGIQPYGLDGSLNDSSAYHKFTNNDKVRRYYKGCTEKLEQLALDHSGNSIENFLQKLKPKG